MVDSTSSSPLKPPVRLDDLIEGITKTESDPLRQLSAAVMMASHLGDLADHLIGHFVDRARRAGASWTEIGRSMGVSKQAAQKRFVPKAPHATQLDPQQGFHQYTPRARTGVLAAQEAARQARNPEISPIHLVLGLVTEKDGLAARLLTAQGVSLDAVREAATARLGEPVDEVSPLIPFDTDAKQVLELTFQEAARLGHGYVGTEHILLAVLEWEGGNGLLAELGVDKKTIEERLVTALNVLPAQSTDESSS